jgi:hypothetical protein
MKAGGSTARFLPLAGFVEDLGVRPFQETTYHSDAQSLVTERNFPAMSGPVALSEISPWVGRAMNGMEERESYQCDVRWIVRWAP